MARNRVIYASEALFVGPSPSTGGHFEFPNTGGAVGSGATLLTHYINSGLSRVSGLSRIQSINYDFGINRVPVNQFGELGAIDRVILEQPTVNLNFAYLLNSVYNEKLLGFTITTGGAEVTSISGFLNKISDDRNYFIKTVPEGSDAKDNYDTSNKSYVIGIGNGFITNYTAQGSVGNFAEASVAVEALNFKIDQNPESGIPAVNPVNGNTIPSVAYKLPAITTNPSGSSSLTLTALRPGDINISLGSFGTNTDEPGPNITDWKAQSFNVGVGLARTPLLKLGSKYAFSREINFPVTCTASFTANLGDLRTGNLVDFLKNDTDYNLTIDLRKPDDANTVVVKYELRGANLDNQSYSSSIGRDKSVTLNFSAQIAGPSSTTVGLLISGHN